MRPLLVAVSQKALERKEAVLAATEGLEVEHSLSSVPIQRSTLPLVCGREGRVKMWRMPSC